MAEARNPDIAKKNNGSSNKKKDLARLAVALRQNLLRRKANSKTKKLDTTDKEN